MLVKAPPRPGTGAGADVLCHRRAPAATPCSFGLAGGPRRGGACGRLVVAAAGERSEAVQAAAVAGGKQLVNGSTVAGQLCFSATDYSVSSSFSEHALGMDKLVTSTVGKSTNILWHDCPIGQSERQKLLNQKGCVVWITGLSGSGKSTLACALSRELYSRGHLTYILDGDNLRHGLNRDLSFEAKDRAENIRRVGEVAKLFADAGLICIASLISPYKSDRSSCRNLLHSSSFIEVFLNVPLEVCEARDPKGLYKLARAGKIKGFTGIDDPYEPPSECEIVIHCKPGDCATPKSMANKVVAYLEANGFLQD